MRSSFSPSREAKKDECHFYRTTGYLSRIVAESSGRWIGCRKHRAPKFSVWLSTSRGIHTVDNVSATVPGCDGVRVDVGVVEKRVREEGKYVRRQLEVDFVANRGSDRIYIQSALEMRTPPEKAVQEKVSLFGINDSFRKIVLVRGVVRPLRDDRGVVTMSVFDFLLDENSLAGI